MNVLFVTSEVAPFAKTGGLADVSAALPRQLHRLGHDVRVFVPFYGRIDTHKTVFSAVPPLRDVTFAVGPRRFSVSVFTAPLPGSDLAVHFVQCPPLYARSAIYTHDRDEHLRFLVLGRAALECSQRLAFAPDVIHCNDWQTALVPLTVKTAYVWDRLFARARTVLTIHNLNYQGVFRADTLSDTGLAAYAHLFHQEQLDAGRINYLLHGILYADGISTVSPTYAREIQSEEHGAGLHAFLRARSSTVVGILNGVDYDEWSPETDRHIPFRYSAADLAPKEGNKKALVTRMGLPYLRGVPVIGIVSRLASQKGFDLLPNVLPRLLAARDVQLVVLGSGESRFEAFFGGLAERFPRKAAFRNGFSNELAHLIEAGADVFLMPSRYEPCGLNQMYSLRYGTVPVVRKTGGLADTVDASTGFVFEHYDATGVGWALDTALDTFRDSAAWQRLMRNGMARSYSWEDQARLYEKLYSRL